MDPCHWPLFGLTVRTPRLELVGVDDALAARLATLAAGGIHDPDTLPFAAPWTDEPSPVLERKAMQHVWRSRAEWTADTWHLNLATLVDGEVVGTQGVGSHGRWTVLRVVGTGSWLGRAHQGRGIGKEMRAAVLHLAFAGLGAVEARTDAFEDNPASLGVTRALGYEPNGYGRHARRDQPTRMLSFVMTRERWESRRRDDIVVEGLEPCLPLFGLDGPDAASEQGP
ncbi:MAG TPA: GNAT family protein [Acidimicrobiales bacterium]|nr:GNAT family protein [Acidimicrobiales bacterium]